MCGKVGEIMQKTSGEYIHLGDHRQVIMSFVRRRHWHEHLPLLGHAGSPFTVVPVWPAVQWVDRSPSAQFFFTGLDECCFIY